MKAGSVFVHQKFKFSDGEMGKKLFVVLGSDQQAAIVVKTTSKHKHKNRNEGCQVKDHHPNFFIPKNKTVFKEDTWIGLDEFFELKFSDLLNKKSSREIDHVGDIEETRTKQLLNCVLHSEDLTGHQEEIIKNSLNKLN